MKVILLNGRVGAGKSHTGTNLHRSLENSAYIEGDAFLEINPFTPTKENYNMVAKNIINQVKIFSKFKTIDYVIIPWVLWYKETFDILEKKLKKFNLYKIYLKCPVDQLKIRVTEDIKNNKRHPDNYEKTSREVYFDNFSIVNSNQPLENVLKDIKKIINN